MRARCGPGPFLVLSTVLLLGFLVIFIALNLDGRGSGDGAHGWPAEIHRDHLGGEGTDTGAEPARDGGWRILGILVNSAVLLAGICVSLAPGAVALYLRARRLLEEIC